MSEYFSGTGTPRSSWIMGQQHSQHTRLISTTLTHDWFCSVLQRNESVRNTSTLLTVDRKIITCHNYDDFKHFSGILETVPKLSWNPQFITSFSINGTLRCGNFFWSCSRRTSSETPKRPLSAYTKFTFSCNINWLIRLINISRPLEQKNNNNNRK